MGHPLFRKNIVALVAGLIFKVPVVVGILTPMSCTHVQDELEDEQLPATTNLTIEPSRLPKQPTGTFKTIAVGQILCSYKGAVGAPEGIQRSRKQAMDRAKHLVLLARSQNSDFGNLARRYSDDPASASKGGDLGIFTRGELHPDLQEAALTMGIGQISDMVETPKGFHILIRNEENKAQAAEILISYQGAKKYVPRQMRSRKNAQVLGNQILNRLQAGSDFEQEAIAHSDLPNYGRGGIHASFVQNSRHPDFEKIVWSLQKGALSKLVETKTGFHIIKRLPLEKAQVRRVLIQFQTEPQEPSWDTEGLPARTKTDAYKMALNIQRMIRQADFDFAALAARYSEGPERKNAGLMEPFERGQIDYQLERAAFALERGQISDIVECAGYYAIIKRVV